MELLLFIHNYYFQEGGSVEFKCFVSCAPLTTTTWERDGIPMIPGANISLTEKTGVTDSFHLYFKLKILYFSLD